MPVKLKALLTSRKFWAAVVGLVVVSVKAYRPDFPITADQLIALVVVIVGYIFGTAIESGLQASPPFPLSPSSGDRKGRDRS
jgi:hypothetical protein